jgi:hypothetical protein
MGLRKKKSLIDQAGDYLEQVKPHAEAAYESARDFMQDTVAPAVADAREKAGPAIADARDKAGPVIADARKKAAPVVAAGAAMAAERATAARDLADAKVAELKGEKPKKKGKIKRFVLFAGIAGGVAFVAKKLQGGGQSDNWQSSYNPSPAPTPPTPPTPSAPQSGIDDPGGASPDEALSDATEEAHPVSTPDDPAEVVDLEDGKKK